MFLFLVLKSKTELLNDENLDEFLVRFEDVTVFENGESVVKQCLQQLTSVVARRRRLVLDESTGEVCDTKTALHSFEKRIKGYTSTVSLFLFYFL